MGTISHQRILHSNHQLISSQPLHPDGREGDQGRLRTRLRPTGHRQEDISLTIKDKLLTIAAERKTTPQSEEGKQEDKVCYRRLERFSGAVTRTIKLPDSIDRDRITAVCKDGQLTIILPKQEKEELSIRNIEIK